ncbi:MAG: endonuclease domain-containing protein [Melioribacteraceae bacterium]|nr:endonuclease domain-containing protein [Melioribacteraceae bacterium]
MTKLYNRQQEKEKRRELRQNETIAETNMWSQLRNRGCLSLKFKRQFSIGKYIIDFYCPEYKIAIELDGNVHELEDIKKYDAKSQKYLEDYGIHFIRITNNEYLGNPNKAFDKIERSIKEIIGK